MAEVLKEQAADAGFDPTPPQSDDEQDEPKAEGGEEEQIRPEK